MILMTSPIAVDAWPSAATSAVIADARVTACSATWVASSLALRSRSTVSSRARALVADRSPARSTSSRWLTSCCTLRRAAARDSDRSMNSVVKKSMVPTI